MLVSILRRSALGQRVLELWPGVGIAAITGMAALFLSQQYHAPAMLFSLLLGMTLSFLYKQDTSCKKGIEFTASTLLRLGVALLGLRIALDDVVALGWQTALVLALAILTTILLGLGLARIFGIQKRFGVLTGASVSICGASAAMAMCAVLPDGENKDRDTLLTVIGVTALSTIAMIGYPILVNELGMDDVTAGIFLGGTIHDVAQVVGAGYSVSEEAGNIATLTKLVRVAMLVPVVLVTLFVLQRFYYQVQQNKRGEADASTNASGSVPKLPTFLVGFVVLMLINSIVTLPVELTQSVNQASSFLLVIAMTAIGMKSDLGKLIEVGFVPVFMICAETLWIGLLVLGYLLI